MPQTNVGRHVEYVPIPEDNLYRGPDRVRAAVIADVLIDSATKINVAVLDSNGTWVARQSIRLLEVGEAPPAAGSYCRWPGHTVKTEDAAAAAGETKSASA